MNKKQKAQNINVSVLTLGCSKNVVDSEKLIGLLGTNNINITDSIDDSDTLIVNTCGFIGPAKDESINVIQEASALKRDGKIKNLIVMGCLSERYSKELKDQLPEVDHIFGVDSNQDILKVIAPNIDYCLTDKRKLLTPSHYAYIKISEGCNHECSFCAIPLIRGKYKSRTQEDIVREVESLVQTGIKEFNLIAQDSTYYGRDIAGKSQLAELLDRVSDVQGADWIRLHYAYPTAFPHEILDVIASKPNICNYVDIPFQHASNKILKSMRRGTSAEYIEELIYTIREKIKNAAVRSTFIVGYPGESEEDFRLLYDFIERMKLDRVGVFTYSHEDGTHAYSLIDTVPNKVKEKRKEELMLLQQGISLKKNELKIGKTLSVLVDEVVDNGFIGRTEHDAPEVDNLVHFTSDFSHKPGDFVDVLITDASEYDIYGKTKN